MARKHISYSVGGGCVWPVNIYLIQFSFTPTYKLSENGECILLYHKAELLVHDYFVV